MKKKICVLLCVLVLLALSFVLCVLVGCSKSAEALPPPENVVVDKRILTWDSVENATGYVVYIDNEKYETEECRLDLHELTLEGGTFNIDVVASGDQKKHLDSSGMRLTVALDAPPESGTDELGFSYTFCEDVVGYEVSAGTADLTGTVVIPEYFCDYPVKKLAKYALNPYYLPYIKDHPTDFGSQSLSSTKAANTETTAVVLPSHLEEIGEQAFVKLLSLTEIVIPDSVTKIGTCAFYNCGNLTRAVLPKNLTVIPGSCFETCPLYEIILPETLVEIQASAFSMTGGYAKYKDSLPSSVTIPSSVQYIGWKAFEGQRNLETIIFEDSTNIRVMGAEAFDYTAWHQAQPDSGIIYLDTILYSCQHIVLEEEVLYITEPITAVAEKAFGGFSGRQRNVKKLVITAPLKVIPYDAFTDFKDVIEIILPPELEIIGKRAFYDQVLTHVYFSGTQAEYEKVKADSVTEIGGSGGYPLEDNVVYFYSETEPTEPGRYWHYVDGEATPWFE